MSAYYSKLSFLRQNQIEPAGHTDKNCCKGSPSQKEQSNCQIYFPNPKLNQELDGFAVKVGRRLTYEETQVQTNTEEQT